MAHKTKQSAKRRETKLTATSASIDVPWQQMAFVAIGLVVLIALTYSPIRHNGFVGFDDPLYITENPQVQSGLSWSGVVWAFTTGHASNWHPLTWISHMLDAQLFGLNPTPHHLVNVALHAANSCLLFALLVLMTGALSRSALVAALFAVHPMHVESVAWAAERKDVLSTFFAFLTLLVYVVHFRRNNNGRCGWATLFFALGLLAKPMLVTLPFLMVLLDCWPLNRISFPFLELEQRPRLRQLLWEKTPLFCLALLSSVITVAVQKRGGAIQGLDAIPFPSRLCNAAVAYIAYLGKLIYPAKLAVFYPLPDVIPTWKVIGSLLLIAAGTVLVYKLANRYKYLCTGWFWFLGALVPVIGLVQVGSQSMADRYTYIPSVGFFVIVCWGVPDIASKWNLKRNLLVPLAAIAVTVSAIIATTQIHYWRSERTLWEHALAVTNDNYFAHVHLGNLALSNSDGVLKAPDPEAAIAHYAEALKVRPDFDLALDNMGIVLLNERKHQEALPYLHKAIQVNPSFSHAHNDLGVAMERFGRFDEAIAEYSEAVRLDPDLEVAHVNLAKLFATRGRVDEAIREYSDAVRLRPDDPIPHYDLGIVFNSRGDMRRAVAEFSTVLKLKPDSEDAKRALNILSRSAGGSD